MTIALNVTTRGRACPSGRRIAAWLAAACLIATGTAGWGPAALAQTGPVKPRLKVPPVYVSYTTRDGDTLYDIAGRYLADPADWALLSRLNHVPAPRRMSAGIVLRLPSDKLKQDPDSARVVATSGPVEHAFGNGPYLLLKTGETLAEGDRVRTGRNGFVTLELPDGSYVTIAQDGELDIEKLRRVVLTGAADRVFELRHGEVESQVTHATRGDDRFQIRSPSVVAGVRGTRFRVDYDGGTQTTAVAVIDGAVGVDPAAQRGQRAAPAPAPGVPLQASAQLLKASFGNVTRSGGAVGIPLELLPAPALAQPARVQDGKTVAFDIEPAAQAVGYRVQISRDADQLDLVRDLRVATPRADFGDLPDGTYFVRVASTDSHGLDGLPNVYAFERRQFGLDASASQRAGSRDYDFRWFVSHSKVPTSFRFVLAQTADLSHPVIDRTDLPGGELVVSDLPAGVYYWTIVAEQFENGRFYEKSSAVRSFTLAR
ncbi:FecR family protein [Paraburkholderia sp.]|uniref:FecR family protein n=1 Tax=Paraburkholderia sp. TaxID=1926495 RepID=UPI002F41F850